MARDLSQLSTTPANNDATGGFKTGMRPSSVKNAGWADESILAQLFNSKTTAGGTANAITLTNPVPFTSLTNGLTCVFWPSAANTGAATFAPDGLTAKNIFYLTKTLVGGELQANVPATVKYDGTQWNLVQSAKGPAADFYIDSGTVNAIVLTINTAAAATAAGLAGTKVRFKAAFTTTTANPTITINGVAFGIILNDNSTLAPAGSIISSADTIYEIVVGSSNPSNVTLMNPSRATFSYTGTMSGVTTTVTGTITGATAPDGITKTLSIPTGFSGTSNTTACTITGGPTAMQPTTAQGWSVPVTDNSVTAMGNMSIAAGSGTITFGNQLPLGNGGSFTAGGTKTVPRLAASTVFTVTYPSSP